MSEVTNFLEFFAGAFAGAIVSKMFDAYIQTKDVTTLNQITLIYTTVFLVGGIYVFFVWVPKKNQKK